MLFQLFTFPVFLFGFTTAITCYACIKWTGNGSEPDWTYLNKIYNQIPTVSPTCDTGKNAKFNGTTKTVACIATCTKVTYTRSGLIYNVRGCKENLYRSSPSSNPCDADLDPSYCDCTTDFCNGVGRFSLSWMIFVLIVCIIAIAL